MISSIFDTESKEVKPTEDEPLEEHEYIEMCEDFLKIIHGQNKEMEPGQ